MGYRRMPDTFRCRTNEGVGSRTSRLVWLISAAHGLVAGRGQAVRGHAGAEDEDPAEHAYRPGLMAKHLYIAMQEFGIDLAGDFDRERLRSRDALGSLAIPGGGRNPGPGDRLTPSPAPTPR